MALLSLSTRAPSMNIYPTKCPGICSVPALLPAGAVAVLCALPRACRPAMQPLAHTQCARVQRNKVQGFPGATGGCFMMCKSLALLGFSPVWIFVPMPLSTCSSSYLARLPQSTPKDSSNVPEPPGVPNSAAPVQQQPCISTPPHCLLPVLPASLCLKQALNNALRPF